MVKTKKFITLFESYMRRYDRGGFLVGDIFKFNDNFKRDEAYTKLGQNVKDLIDEMIESGLNIRVVDIKDVNPQRYPAATGGSLEPVLTVALDTGGGRYTHYCSIPCCLGQPDPIDGPNLPPIPDAMRRKDKVNIKPEEVSEDEENLSNMTDRGDGRLQRTQRSLPRANTTIPSKSATPSPEVNSYTKEYMKGLN
jgi:hypothetical protein